MNDHNFANCFEDYGQSLGALCRCRSPRFIFTVTCIRVGAVLPPAPSPLILIAAEAERAYEWGDCAAPSPSQTAGMKSSVATA